MFLFDVILDSTTSSLRDPQFDILLFKKKSTELSMKGLLSLSHVVSTFWPFIGERRIDTQYTYIKKKKKERSREGKKKKKLGKFLKRVFDCHWNWSPLRVQVAALMEFPLWILFSQIFYR